MVVDFQREFPLRKLTLNSFKTLIDKIMKRIIEILGKIREEKSEDF